MDSLYVPPPPKGTIPEGVGGDDIKEKYELVKLFEKALRKPKFMVKKIKERDCPVHIRWCSASDTANADTFMEAFVDKIRKEEPSLSPFTVLENVSVVFPTVTTVDMFQMLNNRNSFKSECLQWTGYSEAYAKMWAILDLKRFVLSIALQIFLLRFDDMPTLVKLFEDITEVRSGIHSEAHPDSSSEEDLEDRFIKAADMIKQAVYSVWFKRVEESVSSLGDYRNIQRIMYMMVEYKLALGLLPYEPVKAVAQNDRWINPIRKIPDPFTIIILKNKRDNSYSCWNYRTNSEVLLLLDKFGVPFDTKLGQLLKAEYTHAELFTKQNSAHLSDGYILSELKEDPADEGEDDDEISREYKQALIAQRDKDDEEQWRRQLGSLDDDVKYEDTNGGHPTRIVLRGLARPQRLPYLSRGGVRGKAGGTGGAGGGKGGGGGAGSKSDPASDLVRMLQKQITTGERAAQDISKMLKSTVTDENSYLKGASKKLEDILSSKHDFIAKIHKNLDAVSKEIDGIATTADDASSSDTDGFGVIPIRRMINGVATSMATVHDMVEKLEASLLAVGINPTGTSETDMFREMDTRIGALTSTANHKTCMEMRRVMETVESMMDHMETMINSHTSSLTVPAATHERMCVDDLAFNIENFDDDFAGVLKGPGEVAPVSFGGGGAAPDSRAAELYAEYHSKMKEANDMYKTLKGNYVMLIKNFQAFQVTTLKDVSKIAEFKSKTVDARNLAMIYKKFLGAQTKMNKEGMTKIEGVLQDLEAKMKEVNHIRQRDKEENMENLKRIQGDLQAILSATDVDEPMDYLEDAVLRSDEVLSDLRARRMEELNKVSTTFQENLKELRKTFPMIEEARDKRKRKLQDDLESGDGDDKDQPSTSKGGGVSSSSSSTADATPDNSNEVNTRIGANYGAAMDRYHKMADSLGEERERAIAEAKIKDLERRERVQKARVKREAAIEEHNHIMAMKRCGDILRGRDEAKRRKTCKGTHEADLMTIGKLRPMPQMLVVKDHFRKAKIMPGVPEKHMSDSRKMLRLRWDDLVENLFPLVTIVDNHGVKTWGVNEESVADTIVIPFLKMRYGLKNPGSFSLGLSSNSIASVRVAFNNTCDEFATELLLHSANGEYRHLMTAFKPNIVTEKPPKLRDFDGRQR